MQTNDQTTSHFWVRTIRSSGATGLFYFILILFAIVQAAWARPAEIILLRHAEKPPDESSVHLSKPGKERAAALVGFMTTTPALVAHGPPAALFATQKTAHGHSRRTYETLEPLAKHLKVAIQTPFLARDYAALAKHILRDPVYDGKTVVVCWVHDYLPELAGALGVKPKPATWKHNAFDQVWLITYRGKKASLATLPQRLLPGDSEQ